MKVTPVRLTTGSCVTSPTAADNSEARPRTENRSSSPSGEIVRLVVPYAIGTPISRDEQGLIATGTQSDELGGTPRAVPDPVQPVALQLHRSGRDIARVERAPAVLAARQQRRCTGVVDQPRGAARARHDQDRDRNGRHRAWPSGPDVEDARGI